MLSSCLEIWAIISPCLFVNGMFNSLAKCATCVKVAILACSFGRDRRRYGGHCGR